MRVSITPLGTRGWIPGQGRHTMCTLVRFNDANILLDCGTGVSRLMSPSVKAQLSDGPLNIIFSHYHLDHFVGLTYLPGIFNTERPIRLIGPSKRLLEVGLKRACETLVAPPMFGTPLGKWSLKVELLEFAKPFTLQDITVRMLSQKHKGGSVSLRFDDAVAYVTDAAPNPETCKFSTGVACLIHEAWEVTSQNHGVYHCNLSDALDTARAASVKMLVPVHYGPAVSESEICQMQSVSVSGLALTVPTEGETIAVME